MKKKEIVKSNELFNKIINTGNKVKTKYFTFCSVSSENSNPRFGIAVGKKVGNAVTRNHIKRQIRSLVDDNKLLFKNNTNYIIIGNKNCLKASFKDMDSCMKEILNKEQKYEK